MITYTCTGCSNDVPFIYQGALCVTCYQQAGHTLTVGEFAAEMKHSHPDNPFAWND